MSENALKTNNNDDNSNEIVYKNKLDKDLKFWVDKSGSLLPWDKLLIILISMIIIFFITLFKGSKRSESIVGIKPCSAVWWVLTFLFVPISIVIIAFIIIKFMKEATAKQKVKYVFRENEQKWNKKLGIKIALIGVVVGLISSMVGIGGGILMSPLFMQMKFPPQVASYTSGLIILFTAGMSCIQYIVMGKVYYDYAIAGSLFGLFGSLFAKKISDKIAKFNRQSFIAFGLCGVMILAAISLLYSGISKIVDDVDKNLNIFRSNSKLC